MTLSCPSNFIPSRTVVLAIVSTIKATLKMSVDDDDEYMATYENSKTQLQEGLLSLTAQRAACETCILPIGG